MLLLLGGLVPGPSRSADVGTNLDALVDFSAQYVFVDAFKQSRTWLTQTATDFDTGEAEHLDLDADGWVRSLPAPGSGLQFDRVATLLFFNGERPLHYPGGRFVVTYDGEGELEYRFDAVRNEALSVPGREVLDVTSGSGFAIVLRSTNPADYLRNIRVFMPGFDEASGPAQVFHPDFLALIEPFSTLRFMDWMHTNHSPQEELADRPLPSEARYTLDGKGVPLEVMVDLANRTDKDPWFNMPHRASDGYVTQFATLVRQQLEPGRRAYVEYSNEVWNSGFSQGAFVEAQGVANFPGPDSGFTKRMNQHGRRTAEICDLWEAAFGTQASRVECVLGAQAANTFTSTEAADCRLWTAGAPCHEHHLDGLAIAPYFGGYLGDPGTADTVAALSLDQIFTEIESGGVVPGGPPGGAIAQTVDWVVDQRAEATARGLDLVAYEGGQHLVGFFGAENNQALTDRLIAANRDPRIGAAYTRYLEDSWEAGGGELFVHFNSASSYTKFGSWGAVERLDTLSTPKQNALVAFAGGTSGPCVADDTTLCLNASRFRVRVAFETSQGASGSGHGVALTADTGYFWFFNAANVELVVKVLGACGVNQRYWVFAGGLTDVSVELTVTDTSTGTVRTYANPLGTPYAPLQDTGAFATCP